MCIHANRELPDQYLGSYTVFGQSGWHICYLLELANSCHAKAFNTLSDPYALDVTQPTVRTSERNPMSTE